MQFSKEILKGSADAIVLQVLEKDGEAYGYELIKAISKLSNNIFEFQEGTLYPLLYRLESKGFVNSRVQKTPSGKERRYYHITTSGKKLLAERKQEFATFFQGLKQIFHLTA